MKVFRLDLAIVLRLVHGQIQLLDPLVILKRSKLALRVAALASAVGQILDGQSARRIARLHNRVYPKKKKKDRPTLRYLYSVQLIFPVHRHRIPPEESTESRIEFTHTDRPSPLQKFPYHETQRAEAQCHGVATRCRRTSLPRDITPSPSPPPSPLENTNTPARKTKTRLYPRPGGTRTVSTTKRVTRDEGETRNTRNRTLERRRRRGRPTPKDGRAALALHVVPG